MLQLLVALSLQSLPGCRESYEQLRYRDAVSSCRVEVQQASTSELPELYLFLGLSYAALDEAEEASWAFASLLALRPSFPFPARLSPKLRPPFEAARRGAPAHPLGLGAQVLPPAARSPGLRLRLWVEDGPARPIVRFSLRLQGREQTEVRRGDSVDVQLRPRDPTVPSTVEVRAYDRFGGALGFTSLEVSPAMAPSVAGRPAWRSWKLWGGVGIGVAALGLGAGLFAAREERRSLEAPYADDAVAMSRRAKRAALGANIAYGVGAALGVGATLLLVTDPG